MKSFPLLCVRVWLALTMTGVALAASPQTFNRQPDLKARGVDGRRIAEMDALLQSFVDEQKLSSVVGFVAQGGDVIYEKAFGWKDVENRVPAQIDDYYVLFSQTKAITTVAFMSLVEQGLVSIDDPVSKFFPEISDRVVTEVHEDGTFETRPAKSPMTFAHLMSHTSGLGAGKVRDIRRARGLGNDAPSGFGGPIPEKPTAGQRTGGTDFNSKYLADEMLALAKLPLGFDPGTRWEYHLSTNMLGYMIERISGRPLRDYVKEKVLAPLGMDDTDWFYAPDAVSRFVKPYRSIDGRLEPGSTLYSEAAVQPEQTYAEGAIGLNGPIGDYAKFCQMLLNQGEFNGRRILKPETIELMTTLNRLPPDSGAGEGFQFGLGFELFRKNKPAPAVSDRAFAWGGLFGTQYIIEPEHDFIALYYVNMYQAEPLYPRFLAQAYRLVGVEAPVSDKADRVVVLEQGGRGGFPAIVTEEAALPGITVFRPRDLAPFGGERKLPVLLWANGACANTTYEHKNFLNEIASHGYLVLGIGLLDELEERGEASREPTQASQLLVALDWILAQNASATSDYHGKIDGSKIAAMGMSCGGLQAIEISRDPRITTSVICNSGVLPEPSTFRLMPALTKDDLKHFHGPVLYIMGGPSDIAYANGMDDFERVNHVPIAITNLDVGHGGTYHEPHGGEFTRVALAWLDWHLKGRQERKSFFLGADSELARDPKWTVQVKNFE